ncbi:MAG: hypothetical protein QME52_03515 [Bacteroidota bacterium]|nr:hypothetical protein [Bacteroidota bacterium]
MILKRIGKAIAFIIGVIAVLLLVLIVFTQTQFFRDRLRVILVSSIQTKINGSLKIGTIDGNFLNGFTVDSLAIYDGENVFLTTRKITCRYEPLPLLRNKLIMNHLIIEQPTLHFSRSVEGDWNINKLFKPDEDTSHIKFNWALFLKNIELKNATVTLYDSASLLSPSHWTMPASYFEYHNFSINDLNIKISAIIKDSSYSVNINHLSCYSPQSQFELSYLKGNFELTDREISAKNLIIQTGRSYIECDARMKIHPSRINIFNDIRLEDMKHDSTSLKLRALNIDLSELKSFLPQVAFLDGSASIDLTTVGEFGNLRINNLNVKTLESTLNISGYIKNLHDPQKLYLDIVIGNSKITPTNISQVLPLFSIPKFSEVEPFDLFTTYVGEPLDFKTQISLKGATSSISIEGEMNLKKHPVAYSASFLTTNLNLGKYLNNEKLDGSISSSGTIAGKGFSINEVDLKLDLKIDSAEIFNNYITNSKLTVIATPFNLETSMRLASQKTEAQIGIHGDFSNRSNPQFAGDFELTSLDIAELIYNQEYRSDINLQGKFSGSGNNLDDVSAHFRIALLPSTFQDHVLNPETIVLNLDQSNSDEKHFEVKSQILDADITGSFNLQNSTDVLADHLTNLYESIIRHASPESISTFSSVKKSKDVTPNKEMPKIDLRYQLHIKDLDPISSLLRKTPFNALAEVQGFVHGDAETISFSCEGNINEFYYGTAKGGVLLKNGTINFSIDSLYQNETLERLGSSLNITADSGFINLLRLDDINFSMDYAHLRGRLSGGCLFNSNIHMNVVGNISIQPQTYVIDLDSFFIAMGDYIWQNDQDVQFRLNNEELRIMRAVMKRNKEYFSISGALSQTKEFNITASLREFDIAGLGYWINEINLTHPKERLSGITNTDIHLTGSVSAPIITTKTSIRDAYFRETKIGNLNGLFDYQNQTASINIEVRVNPDDTTSILSLKGKLPIDLSFTSVDDRFPAETQHLKLESDRFDISVLDPILQDFDKLSGSLSCHLNIYGTPRNPQYDGLINIEGAQFLFMPNNITYTFSGGLEAHDNHFNIKSLRIKNVKEKGLEGETSVTGLFTIKNFKFDSFDLTAHGQFLVMTEATKRTSPSMYGILLTETDATGLNLKGTLLHPYLSGQLFVREANLTFPPSKTTALANLNLTLNHQVIDDTSKSIVRGQKVSRYYADDDSVSKIRERQQVESSIIDRFRYNLLVETRGPTALTMIFTPSTGEELYAELDGKLSVINEQGTPNIYGDIEVSPRSYYNFFKRFDAKGKLKFVGPWNNPELDIQATYEGFKQEIAQTITETSPIDQTSPIEKQSQQEKKVIVNLNITGTRTDPLLNMSMKVELKQGDELTDWSTQAKGGDVQSDAISFIITGKFREELTSREQQEFTDIGSATGTSVASNLLSSIFSDVLKREFPYIRRAEVTYRGGTIQEGTSINVTATAFKGYLRFGGKIFQDIGNTNVSYQLSLGDFFNAPSIRNLFFEIERKVESENPEDKKLTNEARLMYRFSF